MRTHDPPRPLMCSACVRTHMMFNTRPDRLPFFVKKPSWSKRLNHMVVWTTAVPTSTIVSRANPTATLSSHPTPLKGWSVATSSCWVCCRDHQRDNRKAGVMGVSPSSIWNQSRITIPTTKLSYCPLHLRDGRSQLPSKGYAGTISAAA